MGNEKFCLRWNDFESNISIAFRELRDDKDFFDVTLACDDEQIQAHKVILSACSPFFRMVLRRNPHAHPLLYLKGIKFSDLQSVLNFMYHGEVNVAQEELNSFLLVAEELRVKGLTQNNSDAKQPSRPNVPRADSQPSLAASPLPATPPPPKHHRPSTSSSITIPSASPEVQEVVIPAVKCEPEAAAPDESTSLAPLYPDEEQYEDYAEEEHYADGQYAQEHHQGPEPSKARVEHPEDLYQFVAHQPEGRGYYCTICSKCRPKRTEVRNHIESIHFPDSFCYQCTSCSKSFRSKNALKVHTTTTHGNKTDSANSSSGENYQW